ncbi:unnamed protein product [Paramecium sonneborni]|uniref:Uncharacterized protein n=1 Tax=Paramecium sonneborni TaxID=65129 RepID=A0A8S1LBT5_9CILI|nr:unnamed protein product [Paramecium sonneborni]
MMKLIHKLKPKTWEFVEEKFANKCEDVKNSYQSCSNLNINGMPCIDNFDKTSCRRLICSELNYDICNQYLNHCEYLDKCQTKQCQDLQQEQICRYYNCEWEQNRHKCSNKQPCDNYKTEKNCNQNSSNQIQCIWITNEQDSFCSEQGCRYLSQNSYCRGSYINKNICVQLKDYSCVQCEEIKDFCLCAEQEYCKFNEILGQCESINCNLFKKESDCQLFPFCLYKNEQNICHFNCIFLGNQDDCIENNPVCHWNHDTNICYEIQLEHSIISNSEFIDMAFHIYATIVWMLI